MIVGAPEQVAWTASSETALLGGVPSDSLLIALETVQHIYDVVAPDAEGNQLELRMAEAGEWTARDMARSGMRVEAAAVRFLAGAAHYIRVQRTLSAHTDADREWRKPLVYAACSYNGLLRSYGAIDPQARTHDMLAGLTVVNTLIDPEANILKSERLFAGALRGAQHELVTIGIIRAGYDKPVREARLEEDVEGFDVVAQCSSRMGLPVDVTASMGSVGFKCGINPALTGIKKDVLVVCSGLDEETLQGKFTIDPEVAAEVYWRNLGVAIFQAIENPEVRKVNW